jgi:hypothetical protein
VRLPSLIRSLAGALRGWLSAQDGGISSDHALSFHGALYARPRNGAPLFPDWSDGEGRVSAAGDSFGDLESFFALGTDNHPRFADPNSARFKLEFSLESGLFSGTFRAPDS